MIHQKFRVDIAESGFEIRERRISQDQEISDLSKVLGEAYINAERLFDGPKTVITWPVSGVSVFAKSDEPHSKVGDAVELRFDSTPESPLSIDLFLVDHEITYLGKTPDAIWTQILHGLERVSKGNIRPGKSRQSFETSSGHWVCDYCEPPADLPEGGHHIYIRVFQRSVAGVPKQHYDFQFTRNSLCLIFVHFDQSVAPEMTVESVARDSPNVIPTTNSLTWSQAFFKGLWEYFGRLGGELLISTVKVVLTLAIVTGVVLAAWFFLT